MAGGARGCGRATAESLAAEGARVVLTGRDAASVRDTEQAILASGGEAHGFVADMVAKDGAARIVDGARARFGDADILVVNSPGPVPDRETNRWRGFDNTSNDDFELAYAMFVMSQVPARARSSAGDESKSMGPIGQYRFRRNEDAAS